MVKPNAEGLGVPWYTNQERVRHVTGLLSRDFTEVMGDYPSMYQRRGGLPAWPVQYAHYITTPKRWGNQFDVTLAALALELSTIVQLHHLAAEYAQPSLVRALTALHCVA